METIINYRRKQSYAFILACIIYIVIATLLLLELRLNFSSDSSIINNIIKNNSVPFSPRMRSKGPAPIRYISQPKQQNIAKKSPQRPPPKSMQQQKIKKQISSKNTKNSTTKKSLPKKITPKIPIKQQKTKSQKKDSIPRYKKRSKNRWFKKSSLNKTKLNNKNQQRITPNQFVSKLNQGFNNYVIKKRAKEAQYTIPKINGTTDAIEYEMFIGKMVHTVCDASHLKPLNPYTSLIKKHSIIIKVTCDNKRKISNIIFVKPSYNEQINIYLKNLIKKHSPTTTTKDTSGIKTYHSLTY